MTQDDICAGYAAGRIDQQTAMKALDVDSTGQLLNALAIRGLEPPKPPSHQVEEEVAGFLEILRLAEEAGHKMRD